MLVVKAATLEVIINRCTERESASVDYSTTAILIGSSVVFEMSEKTV